MVAAEGQHRAVRPPLEIDNAEGAGRRRRSPESAVVRAVWLDQSYLVGRAPNVGNRPRVCRRGHRRGARRGRHEGNAQECSQFVLGIVKFVPTRIRYILSILYQLPPRQPGRPYPFWIYRHFAQGHGVLITILTSVIHPPCPDNLLESEATVRSGIRLELSTAISLADTPGRDG